MLISFKEYTNLKPLCVNTHLFCNIGVIKMDNWIIGLIVALIISAVGFAMYHYNKQLASGRHIIARRRAD